MNDIEELMAKEKERIQTLTAPEQLESKLKNALHEARPKRKNKLRGWVLIASLIFCTILVGYNYNALAYYGKQLFGFDKVMNPTLNDLNEQGMGQVVDKTIVLEDGTELTIDGIMSDGNRFILYFTLKNGQGFDSAFDYFSPSEITGLFTKSFVYGSTMETNDAGNEVKGMMEFEPVSPFAKTLTLHYMVEVPEGSIQQGTVTFDYNPNEAMKDILKYKLNKTIQVDKGSITYETLIATPTMTVIEGKSNVENFAKLDYGFEGVELIVNGKSIQQLGSGWSSKLFGSTFKIEYDALPEQIDSIEIALNEFIGYKTVDTTVLVEEITADSIPLDDVQLWIKDISKTDTTVEIAIVTDGNILLDGVSIGKGHKQIPLRTTSNQEYFTADDGTERLQRTMIFDTSVDPESIYIEGVHYLKNYNTKLEIPID